jgi:glycosyltransferase involved in cell wall biosynthesis
MRTVSASGESGRSFKVLVLSRNYPNTVMELLGLWVERLVRHCASFCETKVVSPVPYVPPLRGFEGYYAQFRRIEPHRWADGVEIFHPRFLLGPGYVFHSTEALTYYLGVRRLVDHIRRSFPFDLIHAHFAFPDGVVAAQLGRRYGIPVIITEQAPWRPWMDNYPLVRRQALWAARQSVFQVAISRSVRDSIVHFTHQPSKVHVIPDGVDGGVFTPLEKGENPDPNQILYAGQIFDNKGIDLLLKSMQQLITWRPGVRLVLIGGNYYRSKQLQELRLRRMAHDLGLDNHVQFVGMKSLPELVRYMKESAVLVLASRSESFGSILVEALTCGTPVISTRCGGPEEIVNDQVGILVPIEDVDNLTLAIKHVLTHRNHYNSDYLRKYALEKFSWEVIAHRTVNLYSDALDHFHGGRETEFREVHWRPST